MHARAHGEYRNDSHTDCGLEVLSENTLPDSSTASSVEFHRPELREGSSTMACILRLETCCIPPSTMPAAHAMVPTAMSRHRDADARLAASSCENARSSRSLHPMWLVG